ncbi:hypothetical protein WICPIJ_001234 [Wickerhamomyces pijperi]|uniref:Auxin efflux carrier n=1 Tax=Wickerhamomyces pijperi TaxID=599730 RepID=A0A9P8TRF7_WICPI|nr:hypothetical protein WICPIJ_001234 [Wickerhamomyces pijperi]
MTLNESISFSRVAFLTFQAVIQVVIVCSVGFWAAKSGILNKHAQKYMNVLNVDIFTPALVFSKLAKSLSFTKLLEIIIIPIFYAVSTGLAYVLSLVTSKYLGLDEPETNFVTAMSVFGNSNSLPVSLTVALAQTLPNLEWEDIADDTREKITSRGILYLVVFQQIGQVLRWSWGYNTLLKKKSAYSTNNNSSLNLYTSNDLEQSGADQDQQQQQQQNSSPSPVTSDTRKRQPSDSSSSSARLLNTANPLDEEVFIYYIYDDLSFVEKVKYSLKTSIAKVSSFMNPPLWAMLISMIVGSIPQLKSALYTDDGFVQNTIGEAINQLGQVSIPLILLGLGSNLYPSKDTPPPSRNYSKIVFASLVVKMIILPLILLPIIAIFIKLFPISIMEDPIFVIVAFVLTISPPAIQLSQICQLNEIFENEMAGVLFWGYLVLTLPSLIVTVAAALEALEWAASPSFL